MSYLPPNPAILPDGQEVKVHGSEAFPSMICADGNVSNADGAETTGATTGGCSGAEGEIH